MWAENKKGSECSLVSKGLECSIMKPSHIKNSIDLSGTTFDDLSQGIVMTCTTLSSTKECTIKKSGKTKGHLLNGCVSLKTVLIPLPTLHV